MKKRNAITRKEHTSESAPILSRIRWRTLNRRVTQEQKNRELYTPTISLFRWWARRPHSIIGSILDAAAETIGRIPCISDPFSGGGTVAMEAACREFPVYAQDLYPWPNFSLHTSLSHTSIEEFDSASKHLLSELDHLRDVYRREDERELTHVLRVRVGRCPGCYEPVHLFPNPMLSLASRSSMKKNAFWGCRACGHLTTKRWNLVRFVCPNCNWRHDLKGKSKRFFFCPHCNYKGLPTNFLAGSIVWQAVLVQESVLNKRQYRAIVRTVEEGDPVSFSLASKSHNVLRTPIPDGVETRRLLTMGFRYWGDLYTARQAQVLIEALSIIKDMKVSSSCADRLALAVIGASEMAGLLCRWDRFHLKVHEGVANHRYAHTTLAAETNLLGPMGRGTLKRRLQAARNALVWKQENVNLARNGLKVVCHSRRRHFPEGVKIATGDSTKQGLKDGVVDLVLTDPPYHDDVQYGELARMFHFWLSKYLDLHDVDESSEAVPNRHRGKDDDFYESKIRDCLSESNRTLANDGKLILTFHNREIAAWKILCRALIESGFVVSALAVARAENSADLTKRNGRGLLYDIVLECQKSSGTANGDIQVYAGKSPDEKAMVAMGYAMAETINSRRPERLEEIFRGKLVDFKLTEGRVRVGRSI